MRPAGSGLWGGMWGGLWGGLWGAAALAAVNCVQTRRLIQRVRTQNGGRMAGAPAGT